MNFVPNTDKVKYRWGLSVRPSNNTEETRERLNAEVMSRLPHAKNTVLSPLDMNPARVVVEVIVVRSEDTFESFCETSYQILSAALAVYGDGPNTFDGPSLIGIDPA